MAVDGPVVALKRSPFFKDIFLVAGGWMFQIWREKTHVRSVWHLEGTATRTSHVHLSSLHCVFVGETHVSGLPLEIFVFLSDEYVPSFDMTIRRQRKTALPALNRR